VLNNSRSVAPAAATGVAPLAPVTVPQSISVYVRDVRFTAPDAKPGSFPDLGSVRSAHGQVVDAEGSVVGSLSGGILPGSAGQISVQQFAFTDGTLIGMGSGRLDDQEYAVVGGTGRFAGVSGSYITKLVSGDHGRDAEFLMNLTGGKG